MRINEHTQKQKPKQNELKTQTNDWKCKGNVQKIKMDRTRSTRSLKMMATIERGTMDRSLKLLSAVFLLLSRDDSLHLNKIRHNSYRMPFHFLSHLVCIIQITFNMVLHRYKLIFLGKICNIRIAENSLNFLGDDISVEWCAKRATHKKNKHDRIWFLCFFVNLFYRVFFSLILSGLWF